MKYKILTAANFLIGGVQLIVSFTTIFIVIPKMLTLYSEFDAANINLLNAYKSPILGALAGIVNIFLGLAVSRSKGESKEKYFTISVIYLVFSLIIAGVLIQLSVLSVTEPLYSLSNGLQ